MMGVVVSVDRLSWSDTLESMNCLTARLNNLLGYLSFKNTLSSRAHSLGKYNQSEDLR